MASTEAPQLPGTHTHSLLLYRSKSRVRKLLPNSRTGNVLGFAGHTVSIMTNQLCSVTKSTFAIVA